ncbi:MAG: hypothetical protein CMB20_001340 [Methanobacteriota archaeon]|nr:MAG: hypothetical protein CMB20_001340 [Euryarchaeota archaeon]|tara:strand:- start:100 stop:330 length:231 start_codon:yes stop_codon:yes gene_type:complete
MVSQIKKSIYFRLNDDTEFRVSVPLFVSVMFSITFLTLISNIFALFSVPLFLAVIFAAVSEKMDYRFDDFIHSEEE